MELLLTVWLSAQAGPAIATLPKQECDPAYPDVCIPPAPPDLDCGDISERRFRVYLETDSDVPSGLTDFDPHRFDGDEDGIGCEK